MHLNQLQLSFFSNALKVSIIRQQRLTIAKAKQGIYAVNRRADRHGLASASAVSHCRSQVIGAVWFSYISKRLQQLRDALGLIA